MQRPGLRVARVCASAGCNGVAFPRKRRAAAAIVLLANFAPAGIAEAAPAADTCAVTIPTGRPTRYGTFGNGHLGTTPAPDGVLRVRSSIVERESSCAYVLPVELSWWRWRTGRLEVTARRLDDVAPPLRTVFPEADEGPGRELSILAFPAAGCWEVTGRLNGSELTFVTRVEEAQPTAPTATPPRFRPLSPLFNPKASSLRPARRDGPLRADNISDEEVREIQTVLGPTVRPEMLNISGVVTGCPCEDGPGCREQVWVVTWHGQRSAGLLLSRIDGRWTLGPVQRWWLQREAIDAHHREVGARAYLKAIEALNAKFPRCADDAAG